MWSRDLGDIFSDKTREMGYAGIQYERVSTGGPFKSRLRSARLPCLFREEKLAATYSYMKYPI